MKTLVKTLSLAAALLAGASAHAADQVLTVAIFDFESKDEGVRDLGAKVATLINASLSAEPQIITVERAELEKVLGEQELGLSGTVSPDTAAKVGHLTGAKVLVTGRVFRADKELVLVAKSLARKPAASMANSSKARPLRPSPTSPPSWPKRSRPQSRKRPKLSSPKSKAAKTASPKSKNLSSKKNSPPFPSKSASAISANR